MNGWKCVGKAANSAGVIAAGNFDRHPQLVQGRAQLLDAFNGATALRIDGRNDLKYFHWKACEVSGLRSSQPDDSACKNLFCAKNTGLQLWNERKRCAELKKQWLAGLSAGRQTTIAARLAAALHQGKAVPGQASGLLLASACW